MSANADWTMTLTRLFDGETLSPQDMEGLSAALSDPEERRLAREWLLFEALLAATHCRPDTEALRRGKERLYARTGLAKAEPKRLARSLRLVLAGLLTMSGVVLGWVALGGLYPPPQASGKFYIEGDGGLRRGSTMVTDATPAMLMLGDYCRVEVKPYTRLGIAGERLREEIDLGTGGVRCAVEPEEGVLAIRTAQGVLTTTGGTIAVDAADGVVTILVSRGQATLLSTWGARALSAGMRLRLPPVEDNGSTRESGN